MNNEFDASLMSRLFYFTMHLICWTILIVYKQNAFMQNPFGPLQISFVILVLYSNYLFVTVGNNPGYIISTNEEDVELQIVEQEQNKRYCKICKFNIPNRAKHCKVCKRCVAKYDHHCFWVGGCVGELNQRSFWLFLLVQSIVLILLLWYCQDGLSNYDYYEKDKKRYGQEYGAFIVIFVIMFLFLMFAGGMLIFHTYLIIAGITTYELLKKHQYKKSSTNSLGSILQNIKSTFCHGGKLLSIQEIV
ncbi:unnamed protein product [Paramecium primaurelia]|uniref:Palmitoyltransferase n=1 Tax=Paramecium primaurelia TaxID=5886 RepID=A0A8S1MQB6_PARPR|nr:unnamed protein product [Paramecium primaurelia]